MVDLEDYATFAANWIWTFPPPPTSGPETRWYYLHDALGSVMGVVGGRFGREDDREFYLYDAYGLCDSTSSIGNPYFFTGKRVDAGLQDNVNRTYNYTLGRWMQIDPQRYADGMNLYEYGKSNPIMNLDALGLESCGLFVRCGKIRETDSWDKWGNRLGLFHCDIGKGKSDREDEVDYDITIDRSPGRMILNGDGKGKPCKCAKCPEIQQCADAEYMQGAVNGSQLGNNCHTWTARGLSKCCMKSKWRPAWHAGTDPTCTKWEMRLIGIDPWGPRYEMICVEHSPAY
jgi:RHS repeat-associated protein